MTSNDDKQVEREKIFKVKKDLSSIAFYANQKKKIWKSLKQIIALERSLPWPKEVVHYSSINAPPSFKPNKKYSDLSGFVSPYTDPTSKLQYATTEEYRAIQSFPSDIISGYLAIRRAQTFI